MKFAKLLLSAIFAAAPLYVQAAGVVFCGNTDGQFDLYQADLKTSEIRRLSETTAEELMPAVSPDGKNLAFVSNRAGANSLYLMPLVETASVAQDISAGMGAYANPAFSPDGSKIAAQYAPDPESIYQNTMIVVLNPATRKQEIIIDSQKLKTSENSESVKIVDRPLWVSENLLAYILAEYSDPEAGRLSKSTIYFYDLKKQQHVRVAGGESYFSPDGKPMGFKAVMPNLIAEKDHGQSIVFTAIRGATDRAPMRVTLAGGGKGAVELEDPDYYGPLLFADGCWVYGTMNEDGQTGISWRAGDLKAEKQSLKFAGRIIYPAVVR